MSLWLRLAPLDTPATFGLGVSEGEHFVADRVGDGPTLGWLATISEIGGVPSRLSSATVTSGGELRTMIVRIHILATNHREGERSRRSQLWTRENRHVEFCEEFSQEEATALRAAGFDPESEQRRLIVSVRLPESRLAPLLNVMRGGAVPELEIHADPDSRRVRLADPDGRLREWDDLVARMLDIEGCRFHMPLVARP